MNWSKLQALFEAGRHRDVATMVAIQREVDIVIQTLFETIPDNRIDGKVWALVRVDSNELPIKDRPINAGNDQADHFMLFSSSDNGKSFDRIRDFGDYGEMYMSLLRLQDQRLLLTFTVRDLKPPLGVRALLGSETDDGFEFDFAHDRIMLDTRTQVGKYQGGGFGPTVQLDDGTLVTSYSWRGEDDKTHLEVVRWQVPDLAAQR